MKLFLLKRSRQPKGTPALILLAWLAWLTAMGATAAFAETRYVSDSLEITLRSGQSTQHQIIRTLKSGTALEVLEADSDSGYSRVRAPGGAEGWVLTRFLMPEPSARQRLEHIQSRVAELEAGNQSLQAQVDQLANEKSTMESSQNSLDELNSKLNEELTRIKTTSRRALEMDSENKELRSKTIRLERDNQALSQENEALRDRNARDWFMVGAGVSLLSLLLGMVLSRFGGRRKSSWSSM